MKLRLKIFEYFFFLISNHNIYVVMRSNIFLHETTP